MITNKFLLIIIQTKLYEKFMIVFTQIESYKFTMIVFTYTFNIKQNCTRSSPIFIQIQYSNRIVREVHHGVEGREGRDEEAGRPEEARSPPARPALRNAQVPRKAPEKNRRQSAG